MPAFQSALRMRGLFNLQPCVARLDVAGGFNPPCGCVAFSTPDSLPAAHRSSSGVSIRLADAWPFQPRLARGTLCLATFQSALRMRGLFNSNSRMTLMPLSRVSIRLADAWPFQHGSRSGCRGEGPGFQSALRMRGLFNAAKAEWESYGGKVSIRLADAWPFQRPLSSTGEYYRLHVSIRLADAWPFQPSVAHRAHT